MNPSTPGSYNAAGKGTRADYLIEFIGGTNIFKDSFIRYNKINKETLLDYNPDIIFVASTGNEQNSTSIFIDDTIFENLNAVKNDKIIYLDLRLPSYFWKCIWRVSYSCIKFSLS